MKNFFHEQVMESIRIIQENINRIQNMNDIEEIKGLMEAIRYDVAFIRGIITEWEKEF
jgi:hypothetical protein